MNDFHPVGRIGKRAGNLPECAYQNIGIDNRANWHAHQNYQHECRNQAPSAAKPEVFQREGFVWVLNVLQIAVRNQEARNYKEQVNANVAAYKLVRRNVIQQNRQNRQSAQTVQARHVRFAQFAGIVW